MTEQLAVAFANVQCYQNEESVGCDINTMKGSTPIKLLFIYDFTKRKKSWPCK